MQRRDVGSDDKGEQRERREERKKGNALRPLISMLVPIRPI